METIVDYFETSRMVDNELADVARGNKYVQLKSFLLY